MFVTQETIRATCVFNISKPQSHSLMLQRQKKPFKGNRSRSHRNDFLFHRWGKKVKKTEYVMKTGK